MAGEGAGLMVIAGRREELRAYRRRGFMGRVGQVGRVGLN